MVSLPLLRYKKSLMCCNPMYLQMGRYTVLNLRPNFGPVADGYLCENLTIYDLERCNWTLLKDFRGEQV